LNHAAAAAGSPHRNVGTGVDLCRVFRGVEAAGRVRNLRVLRRISGSVAARVGRIRGNVEARVGGQLLLAAAAAGREQEEEHQHHEALKACG
jgi:hypothetical protein